MTSRKALPCACARRYCARRSKGPFRRVRRGAGEIGSRRRRDDLRIRGCLGGQDPGQFRRLNAVQIAETAGAAVARRQPGSALRTQWQRLSVSGCGQLDPAGSLGGKPEEGKAYFEKEHWRFPAARTRWCACYMHEFHARLVSTRPCTIVYSMRCWPLIRGATALTLINLLAQRKGQGVARLRESYLDGLL